MKLSVKGLMLATGIGWALVIAVVGVFNIYLVPGYAADYLALIGALYPWYNATGTIGDLIIGVVVSFIDGLICGLIFALLYNAFAGKGKKKRAAPKRAAAKKRPAAKKKAGAKKKPAAKKKAGAKKKPAAKKRR